MKMQSTQMDFGSGSFPHDSARRKLHESGKSPVAEPLVQAAVPFENKVSK
jgi:hypothetical protein